jgi:hypothetical protein
VASAANEILARLKTFIEPHPVLHPEAGDIFTPRSPYKISFYFEGGFTVEASTPGFEINFNDEFLLILADEASVYRFRRTALLGFALIEQQNENLKNRAVNIVTARGRLH